MVHIHSSKAPPVMPLKDYEQWLKADCPDIRPKTDPKPEPQPPKNVELKMVTEPPKDGKNQYVLNSADTLHTYAQGVVKTSVISDMN